MIVVRITEIDAMNQTDQLLFCKTRIAITKNPEG